MDWKRTLALTPHDDLPAARKKFLVAARRAHPNKGGTDEKFRRVHDAWKKAQKLLPARKRSSNADEKLRRFVGLSAELRLAKSKMKRATTDAAFLRALRETVALERELGRLSKR